MDDEPQRDELLRDVGQALQHVAARRYKEAVIALENARHLAEDLQAYEEAMFGGRRTVREQGPASNPDS